MSQRGSVGISYYSIRFQTSCTYQAGAQGCRGGAGGWGQEGGVGPRDHVRVDERGRDG